MPTLPTEMLTEEIFPKLPAKSLVRFKCVSKSYYDLISSPEFINRQLSQSLSSNANRILILSERNSSSLKLIDVDSTDSTTATTIPIRVIRHCFGNWVDDRVSIVGTFNGLICIGLEGEMVGSFEHILINPSTREYRSIPHHKHTSILESGEFAVSFGFGFDEINGDFKLVRIVEDHIIAYPIVGNGHFDREVMVFSLKKNSWKLVEKISLDETEDSLDGGRNGVLVNNLLHWVFSSLHGFQKTYRICSFDVQSNKWGNDVPLMDFSTNLNPKLDKEDLGNKVIYDLPLGVVDGCLGVSTLANLSRAVWVMKEYGVKESWVKLFEIACPNQCYFLSIIGPFGFRQGTKKEVLVRRKGASGLFWYDISSKTYDRCEEIKSFFMFDEACFLTESLVSIPVGEKFKPWE